MLDFGAVFAVYFPVCLVALVVRTLPWVLPRLATDAPRTDERKTIFLKICHLFFDNCLSKFVLCLHITNIFAAYGRIWKLA